MSIPAPLGVRQLGAFGAVAWRELQWVLPHVGREVSACRHKAAEIPNPILREEALRTLESERFSTEGAALFSTVPQHRSLPLLRLLATYQIIVDYLDTVSERRCDDVIANGTQLYSALYDALDPTACPRDYYRFHPWSDDGGYLASLVRSCQQTCTELPGYELVKPYLLVEADRLAVTAINHEPNPVVRESKLRDWAAREFPRGGDGCSWFELTAAATSSLTVHALLTLATSRETTESDIAAVRATYFPWMSLASTMLDSYADIVVDLQTGDHSYVSFYGSEDAIVARLEEIMERCVTLGRALPHGDRHSLIGTGMLAVYLTAPCFGEAPMHRRSDELLRASGRMAALQVGVIRAWRRMGRAAPA